MSSRPASRFPIRLSLILVFAGIVPLPIHPPVAHAEKASKPLRLDGVWVAKSAMAMGGRRGMLGWVWNSRFTVSANRFDISHVYDPSMDLHLHGAFSFPADGDPRAIDLDVDEFDMSAIGEPVKYPHCLLRGICQFDGNELVICFSFHESGSAPRPTEFRTPEDGMLLRLVRARRDFDQFPKEVTVRVQDPQGRPAAGASVFNYMSFFVRGVPKPDDPPPTWKYHELAKTGADGAARVPYGDLRAALARDSAGQLVGVTEVSPASALAGDFIVPLRPCCRLRGTIVCDALRRANKSIDWTNAVLYQQNGQQIGECSSTRGQFEFIIAPGRYTLYTYGTNLKGQSLSVEVPPGARTLQVPTISAEPLNLALLAGRPAPELRGVTGWKGRPVRLADERGRLVLLDFWGYWCGPCVAQMPTLIDLYERYHDRGLDIIGIHVDIAGEVDSAAKLDEKTASLKASRWNGRDMPFPIALLSGARRSDGQAAQGTLADYGIASYPTTILINRDGRVVGEFNAFDRAEAFAEIERRLTPHK